MSYKVIENLIHHFMELAASIEQNKTEMIHRWIQEIEKENNPPLELGYEFEIEFQIKLHGNVKTAIDTIKENLNNSRKCLSQIREILHELKEVKNLAPVRDHIIKHIIHPFMKERGWKKKGRSFVKNERGYEKKLMVYSSRGNDYYKVSFRFEIYIKGKDVNIFGETINNQWYTLTPETNINRLNAQILNDLKHIIELFDRY